MADADQNDVSDEKSAALRDSFLQQISQTKPNQGSFDQSDMGDDVSDQKSAALRDSFLQSLSQGSKGKQPKQTEPTDPYEQQIESYAPEAKKRAEQLGYTGAIATGAGEMLGVGPAVREAATDVAAASGYGKGETFGERRQDLKAQYEAQRRASGELYPKTQMAADIASQFLVPGLGEIAGPVAAGAEALGVGSRLARVAGMATEAGAIGAGSAGEEKLIGSKPKSEQPDIGTSAVVGGALGAGLGAAGEAAAKFAPEWMKSLVTPGGTELNNLSRSLLNDEANGTSRMPIDDLVKAVKEGQPILGADIGGTEFQSQMQNIAKKNPEAVADLVEQLKDRLVGGATSQMSAGDRFEALAKDLNNGVELNADKLLQDAKQEFENRTMAAWAPVKDPDLGRGTWLPQWNSLLKEPVFKDAVSNAEANLSRELGPNFQSPFVNTGELPLSSLKMPNWAIDTLNDYGINTVDDLRNVKPITLKTMFNVAPADKTAAAKAAAANQTTQAVGQVRQVMNSLQPSRMVLAEPDNINMHYIDQVRRELDAIKNSSFQGNAATQGGVGRKAGAIQERFTGPLRDKTSPYYSPELNKAIETSADVFGEKDAFTGGYKLLDKDRDALLKTNAFNKSFAMTQAEKTLAKQGLLASLLTKTRYGDGSLNNKMLDKYFDPSNYTAKAMKNIFGADYDRLERFVRTESLFRNTLASMAKTASRSESGLYDRLRELRVVPTWLLSAPLAYAQYAYGVASHYGNQRYARRLAEKLASPDIEQFRDAQKMLKANPRVLSAMAKNAILFSGNAPGAVAGAFPTRAEGGGVNYDSGGMNSARHIPGFHISTAIIGEPVFSGRA